MGYKGGLGSATVDVRGSVKVYADGDGGSASDSANANTTYTVKFVNNEPVAAIDKVSTLPLANAGSKYDTTFYYVNKPVRITDGSYDPNIKHILQILKSLPNNMLFSIKVKMCWYLRILIR